MRRGSMVMLLWAVAAGVAPGQGDPAAAGKVYQARCQGCHQPPDLNLATDRAWLDQLKRTA